MRRHPWCTTALAALLLAAGPAAAADWPMWRHDARRSAASPQELAAALHLQWVRELPALRPAWPDQPQMQLDAAYEPVVLGKTLFVGSSRDDCLIALDTATGAERWRHLADGPVRFPPAAWRDRVFFTSDDGFLYCVEAARGKLLWKLRGAAADRRILGNGRLISTWPARGAPVVADGTVYFAAGVWPFMGVFLHAVDAETGKERWANDGDGSIFIKQPHNADAFAGVAPQGPLVVLGDNLLVPGGRSVPACYDRRTGKLLQYRLGANGKRGGGSEVSAAGPFFFNGGAVFTMDTQKYLGEFGKQVVLAGGAVYTWRDGRCRAYDLPSAGEEEEDEPPPRRVKLSPAKRWAVKETASCELAGVETLIKAGPRLYAGGKGFVAAVELAPTGPGTVPWRAAVPGTVVRLLAADDRLFGVTREGALYCFGTSKVEPRVHRLTHTQPPPSATWGPRADEILRAAGVQGGYCIAWGAGSGELITELARRSSLHILVVDPDEKKVHALRERLTAAGLYGERIAVHAGDPLTFPLPPYLASLMVSEDLAGAGVPLGPEFLARAFRALRPYGGVACLPLSPEQAGALPGFVKAAGLAGARVRERVGRTLLVREGPLPGSADWTHEHADAGNTRVSKDKLVKAPLGLLWFGGPGHDGILPRHGHGPQPQVMGGRIIVEGVDLLRALDAYTGRLLWETPLPGLGQFYNSVFHQPGANAAGSNYVSTPDGIYVAYGPSCLRLDPETGHKTDEFRLPPLPGMEGSPRWGYLNVAGDYLVGGADPIFDPKLLPAVYRGKGKKAPTGDDGEEADTTGPEAGRKLDALSKLLKKVVSTNDNLSSSKHLVVLDRRTGKVLWARAARYGFRHNAVCAGGGRLYAIDRLSGPQLSRLKRRGETPEHGPRLVAFDLRTGKEVWSAEAEVFGTWLSYSDKYDVLVESGRVARDTISDEPRGMRAYDGASGKVRWYQAKYVGPAMIHGDTVLKDKSACDLLTGAPRMRADPLTGELVEWTWSRGYGCNTPAASEHLLTFRSGAAGFLDYCNDGGTGNLGGFRSSCTNNLIVADGVLAAPDYTRTCSCNYQNQTSLALVHMPEAEEWTYFGPGAGKGPVRRAGINLGAPGDRRADNGTLWVEFPSVAGRSPAVPVEVRPFRVEWFRRHSSRVAGPLNWVAASGVKGLESLKINLDGKPGRERSFTVRLVFAEPDGLGPGRRLFHVALQGREVLHDLDVAGEAGGSLRSLVKEFRGVRVTGSLEVRLTPSPRAERGEPVLCGVEVLEEPPAR